MNCPHCGAPGNGSKFCSGCGSELKSDKNADYGDSYHNMGRHQQPDPAPPVYRQPVQASYDDYAIRLGYHPDEHVSTWGWIGRQILLAIPILNIILLLVWCFGGSKKRSLVTWARAQILVFILAIIIFAVIFILGRINNWNISEWFQHTFHY